MGYEHTSFTFLGFTFRQRKALNGTTRRVFSAFVPAPSTEALKTKGTELRRMRMHQRVNLTPDGLARWLSPIVGGWMRYYGRFHRSALHPLLRRVNTYLMRWARRKYRRLRTHKRFQRWWSGVLERAPRLFAHGRWVRVC